jgi:hypothetical protein
VAGYFWAAAEESGSLRRWERSTVRGVRPRGCPSAVYFGQGRPIFRSSRNLINSGLSGASLNPGACFSLSADEKKVSEEIPRSAIRTPRADGFLKMNFRILMAFFASFDQF